jgi:hypothetical protein
VYLIAPVIAPKDIVDLTLIDPEFADIKKT